MKILAIADASPTQSLKSLVEKNKVELICTLGDLNFFDLRELSEITEIPKIGVYGNHDSGKYFESLGILNLHLKTFEYKGFIFGGFEGCVRYKSSPEAIMCSQEEAEELLKNFPRVDVMITHCPPYGINDEPEDLAHQGFLALRKYLETKKPKYLLHGHTFPKPGKMVEQFGETKIVFVWREKIVELTK